MSGERFDLLSLREAMDILGVSRATIDRWRKDKQLPHIKIGKEIWIDPAKLQAWVHLHAHVAVPAEAVKQPARNRVIRVGYQSGAALLWSTLIIKSLGLFEDELKRMSASLEYEVLWHDAPNGMELVEDLIGGDAHIVSIGDYPIMAGMALKRVLPRFNPLFLAFDGKTRGGDGISLVVPSRALANRPEELSGSPIATVGHSSASYRLEELLSAHGLNSEAVVHRTMRDCFNGLLRGNAGASVMWEPYLSWVRATGAGVPIRTDGIGGDYLTGLMADGEWAARNEDVVIAYLKAHLRAHEYIRREPESAAAMISGASGVPVAVAAEVLALIRWDASLYERDVLTLARLGEAGSNSLPRAAGAGAEGIAYGNAYLPHAVQALKLPYLSDSPLKGDWSGEMLY